MCYAIAERNQEMVYFVQGEITKRIKIGYTKRDEKIRLDEMQTGSPDRLRLIKVIGGAVDLEKAIHKKFAHIRVLNEWFEPTKELIEFITYLDNGHELEILYAQIVTQLEKEVDKINWITVKNRNQPKDENGKLLGGSRICLS